MAVADINADLAEEELQALGGENLALQVDVSSALSVAKMAEVVKGKIRSVRHSLQQSPRSYENQNYEENISMLKNLNASGEKGAPS